MLRPSRGLELGNLRNFLWSRDYLTVLYTVQLAAASSKLMLDKLQTASRAFLSVKPNVDRSFDVSGYSTSHVTKQ